MMNCSKRVFIFSLFVIIVSYSSSVFAIEAGQPAPDFTANEHGKQRDGSQYQKWMVGNKFRELADVHIGQSPVWPSVVASGCSGELFTGAAACG